MKRLLSLLPLLLVILLPLQARRVQSHVRLPKQQKALTAPEREKAKADSLLGTALADSITVTGFDKPATSDHESFFITNTSRRDIASVRLRIDYFTTGGKKIHSRDVTVELEIPAGETRQATVRSFDRQRSFHYHRSRPSSRTRTTPFTVAITPLSATVTETKSS